MKTTYIPSSHLIMDSLENTGYKFPDGEEIITGITTDKEFILIASTWSSPFRLITFEDMDSPEKENILLHVAEHFVDYNPDNEIDMEGVYFSELCSHLRGKTIGIMT